VPQRRPAASSTADNQRRPISWPHAGAVRAGPCPCCPVERRRTATRVSGRQALDLIARWWGVSGLMIYCDGTGLMPRVPPARRPAPTPMCKRLHNHDPAGCRCVLAGADSMDACVRGGDDARHCQVSRKCPANTAPGLARLGVDVVHRVPAVRQRPPRRHQPAADVDAIGGGDLGHQAAGRARITSQRTLTPAMSASRAANDIVPHTNCWPRHWNVWSSSGASMPCSLTS
jgi:hypothetical protein